MLNLNYFIPKNGLAYFADEEEKSFVTLATAGDRDIETKKGIMEQNTFEKMETAVEVCIFLLFKRRHLVVRNVICD